MSDDFDRQFEAAYDRLHAAADREINRLEKQLEDCQSERGGMGSAMRLDELELCVREQAAEIEQQKEMRREAISSAFSWRNDNKRLRVALEAASAFINIPSHTRGAVVAERSEVRQVIARALSGETEGGT